MGSTSPESHSASAPSPHQPQSLRVLSTWPHDVSHRATMRISDVLASLRSEFPTVSHSKLRFLEVQGLISPERTASGYRQYSLADIERLRFILSAQRDHYLPLKVIKDQLNELDTLGLAAHSPSHPCADRDGHEAHASVTHLGSLARIAGVSQSVIDDLVEAQLLDINADGSPKTHDHNRVIAHVASELSDYGIEGRHLRPMRHAAQRQAALAQQVAASRRAYRRGSDGSQTLQDQANQVGHLLAQLHSAWIGAEISATNQNPK